MASSILRRLLHALWEKRRQPRLRRNPARLRPSFDALENRVVPSSSSIVVYGPFDVASTKATVTTSIAATSIAATSIAAKAAAAPTVTPAHAAVSISPVVYGPFIAATTSHPATTTAVATGSSIKSVTPLLGTTDATTTTTGLPPEAPTPIQVSSFVVNGSAANNVSASESGNTVTITMSTSLGFYPGEQVVISGFNGTTAFNGRYQISTITDNGLGFTYTDGSVTNGSSDTGGTATPALAGAQRSMVDAIVVTFNQPVAISGANAFTLSQKAFTMNGQVSATQGDTSTVVDYVSYDGGTTWVLTFSASDGSVIAGSIADGDYNLTLDAADVTGGAGLASNYTNSFYRLFGDVNGSGVVTNATYTQLRSTYGSTSTSANYNAAFDYSGTGSVGPTDYTQFVGRFGDVWTNL